MNIFTNGFGHMTKMATIPMYGKILKNLLQNQKANDLRTWYVVFGMWVLHDDPRLTLTYFDSKCILMGIILK